MEQIETSKDFKDSVKVEDSTIVNYPDGGYGWVMVATSFLIHAYANGIHTAFGVFQEYYSSNPPFEGFHSTVAITFIGSVAASGIGLVAFPAGRLTDLFGHRLMCSIGGSLFFVSLLCASYSNHYWQFFLFQGVLFGAGCAFAYFPALTIMGHYFNKNIGLAVGIAVSGSGIGGLILSPLTRWLIFNFGIPATLRFHAITGGSLILFCAYLLKPRLPKSFRGSIDYTNLIKDSRFQLMFIAAIGGSFGYFVPFFFIPSFARYHGMTRSQGALILGITNGASALGRVSLGLIADHFGHVNTFWMCIFSTSLSIFFIWPFANSFATLSIFGLTFGFFIGGFISLFPTGISQLI